jgi:hypothetical protein
LNVFFLTTVFFLVSPEEELVKPPVVSNAFGVSTTEGCGG